MVVKMWYYLREGREINVYLRKELAYETHYDYNYGQVFIHIETKIKSLGFLMIHINDLSACGGMLYKHKVYN